VSAAATGYSGTRSRTLPTSRRARSWCGHPDHALFLCDTWAREPEGTDEYLRNYWTHAERDLDGALTEHFHLLPRITADTLVIHGRQDRVVVEEEVEFLADGIAGAALALIEEAGHCSPIEQPQAFTAVMRLWLTR